MSSFSPSSLADLAAGLDGVLVLPGDAVWDTARSPWQLATDQRPVAVVQAASTADVVATVRAARSLGLRVAPQATGHNAAPLGPLDGTVLLRTSAMRDVVVDAGARTARVGAGALWADVTAAAAPHGLAGLAGTAADVGVVGYTLGGGVSWFGRSHGLAANHVTAAEVVTADGVVRTVSATEEPDLFWALRGGGGAYCVVTALEFALFPLTEVRAGALHWPLDRAAEVLGVWREWIATAPDEVTSIARLLRIPPVEAMPQAVRGRDLVVVEIVSQLDADRTAALLAPLRATGPEVDTVGATPVTELAALHMDPPVPTPGTGDGVQLALLPTEALAALLDVAGPGRARPLLAVDLRHLGGALAKSDGGGALSRLDAEVAVFAVAITPDEASVRAVHDALDELRATLAPWEAPHAYRNFSERPAMPGAFHPADVLERLHAVKTAHDPFDLVRANHPVPPRL